MIYLNDDQLKYIFKKMVEECFSFLEKKSQQKKNWKIMYKEKHDISILSDPLSYSPVVRF